MAERFGYEIKRKRPRPPGSDWLHDLQMILPATAPLTLFDVGANVGEISLRLARAFPASSVFAFEPSAATFVQLRQNTADHRQISPQCAALGATQGSSVLYHGTNSQLHRLGQPAEFSGNSQESVGVDTLDHFAAARGIDHIHFIKTDTEGFDVAVLRGADRLLRETRVGAILAEVTFSPDNTWHTQFAALNDLLAPQGFRLYGVYDPEYWSLELKYANVLWLHRTIVAASAPPGSAG